MNSGPLELLQHKTPRMIVRGVNAQERTRTSTPVRAQALNLLRMPIPPPGLSELLLYRLVTACQFFFMLLLSDFAIKP